MKLLSNYFSYIFLIAFLVPPSVVEPEFLPPLLPSEGPEDTVELSTQISKRSKTVA